MIDASPHIRTPATIWIMRSVIKASIIFSTSGATLAGLQSVHFDKVRSLRLSTKWGHGQATESAGFNSVRTELTFTSSVRAPSPRASCLAWAGSQEAAGGHYSPGGTWSSLADILQPGITHPGHVPRVPEGCSCLMVLQVPEQSGQSAQPCCQVGDVPKQLKFCSSGVQAGWRLKKFQGSKKVISEAGHAPTHRCLPPALKRSFPLLFSLLALLACSSSLFLVMKAQHRDRAKKLQKNNSFY